MTPFSHLIAKLLENAGVGAPAAQTGWGIFVHMEPTRPDTSITIYDTGSFDPPNPKFLLDHPTIQIRTRAGTHDYPACYQKQLDVRAALLGFPSQQVDDVWVVGIWQVTDVIHLGESEGRPILVSNWRAIIEPPEDSGYRIPL